MRFRGTAVVTAVLMTLAACSGGGGDAVPASDPASAGPSTPAPTPATSTGSTTSPSLPSSSPPATVDHVASTTTELVPDTTVAITQPTSPPTESTLDPNVQARLDVIEAVEKANATVIAVVRDPASDAKAAALDDLFVDPLLQGWKNTIGRYRADGLREIENSAEPDAFVIDPSSVFVAPSVSEASVQGCSVTSGVVVETGGNADGTDRVVEDGVARTVVEFTLLRRDGQWKVASVAEADGPDMAASCS